MDKNSVAVILAAGMGTRLQAIANDVPKCMVAVAGKPLIDRMLHRLIRANISEVVVVTGHLENILVKHLQNASRDLALSIDSVHNPRYREWNNFYSLLVAEEKIAGRAFVKIDGDVLIDDRVLPMVMATPGPGVLAVDKRDGLGAEEMKVRTDIRGRILELNKSIAPSEAAGEYIGIDRIDADLVPDVFSELRAMIDDGETHEYYERAYERLIQRGRPFTIADVSSTSWCEIDDEADLAHAHTLV